MVGRLRHDVAAEATRLTNWLRDLLTQVHPALERVLGPRIHTEGAPSLIGRHGGPAGVPRSGSRPTDANCLQGLPSRRRRAGGTVEAVLASRPSSFRHRCSETLLLNLAASVRDTSTNGRPSPLKWKPVLHAYPIADVLTSMPGVGVKTAAACCTKSATPNRFPPRATSSLTPA